MSTRDVEAAIGIANNTVSKLENGEQNITPKYLEAFASLFECAPRDLLPHAPEWAELRRAIQARDARRTVDALARLGVILPRPAPGERGISPELASLAARQIRASAESMEAALDGLRHVADALEPEGD